MGMTMGRKEMIHMSLLKCYTDLGRNAEAEGEYNVLLAMKPNDGVLHFNYARLLVAAGKKGPALASLPQGGPEVTRVMLIFKVSLDRCFITPTISAGASQSAWYCYAITWW
jgi:hypothetical protein